MHGIEARLRPVLTSLYLSSCLLAPTLAHAADALDSDTREAARKLGYSGVEAYQAGNYAGASEKLDKAYRIAAVPSLGLWSARALVKLGKLVEAAERYREVVALRVSSGDQAVQKKAQAEAASDLAALEPKIPKLIVQLEGAAVTEVSLTLDGKPLASESSSTPQAVNPGAYRVEATHGSEHVSVDVTLSEGEQKTVRLELSAAPAPSPALGPPPPAEPTRPGIGTQRTLALAAGGIGLAGVVVGSVFGLKSMASNDEAAQYCSGQVCRDQRGVNAGEDAYSAGNVSTVAMVIGIVGLAGGAALWLTAPRPGQPATALGVGPGSLQLRGSF